MEQKDAKTIQAELARPFAPEDLEWRLQQTEENGKWGIAVPYVTNRAIQARLDEVVGVDGWYNEYNEYRSMPETGQGRRLLAALLRSCGHELLGVPGFRTYYGSWTLSGPQRPDYSGSE